MWCFCRFTAFELWKLKPFESNMGTAHTSHADWFLIFFKSFRNISQNCLLFIFFNTFPAISVKKDKWIKRTISLVTLTGKYSSFFLSELHLYLLSQIKVPKGQKVPNMQKARGPAASSPTCWMPEEISHQSQFHKESCNALGNKVTCEKANISGYWNSRFLYLSSAFWSDA